MRNLSSSEHAKYAKLRKDVERTLLLGQRQIEQAKVRTYFETGQHIKKHISNYGGDHADRYGQVIVRRLAEDLDVDVSLLWRCIQFAQAFPKIVARGRLSWSHYRRLIPVENETKRLELMKRAEKSEWTADQLAEKIRLEVRETLNGSAPDKDRQYPKLLPKRGTLYTYRLIAPEKVGDKDGGLWLDLGFQVRRRVPKNARGFKAGQIVESLKEGADYSVVASKRGEADLFTFGAEVERVVDGDTLIVNIDLGFDSSVRQYLRLRGINCAEMSDGGEVAKSFVEKSLEKSRRIVLASSRSDKYDRYLADVFCESAAGDIYLNQTLLDQNLAVRME